MFVQDDVLLNVDFFFKNNVELHTRLQHALLLLLAAVFGCGPCRLFEQTGSYETKANKEVMFGI